MNSLNIYKLKQKIVAYVKDEGFNLNIMTTTLKSIVSCDVFSLENIMITTLKSVVSCDVFSLEKKKFKELVLVMHFLKHANM
jgi:hypothetical protein